MILDYKGFLFEYSNRKLQFNIIELAKKYPKLISAKWDQDLNDTFIYLYEGGYDDTGDSFSITEEFNDVFYAYKNSITPEFRVDCNAIGIAIDHILDINNIKQYMSWFLYDGFKLKICPGGGKDFLGAKVLGFGSQKVVYHANDKWVLKKPEDVSTFEIYICNKYPDLFAKYVVAGNVVKQQKLEILDIDSSFFNKFNALNDSIRDVLALEGFEYLLIDLHSNNVGYDGDMLKCFDFIYEQPHPVINKTLTTGSISLENLNKKFELDFDFFDDINSPYRIINNTNSTNISGINIVNNSKKEIYLNFSYKMLQPYLNDDLVIFGMLYVKN